MTTRSTARARKPDAPAARRNSQPILHVLEIELRHCRSIFEIGSGTGQHAISFARAMPWLTWQTSDLDENHPGICAWIADAGLSNIRKPVSLDVERPGRIAGGYDAVFSANTAHIMSLSAVRCMFDFVGSLLPDDGVFCLYGPVNQDGAFGSESNRRFDASLRNRDTAMGIRDLGQLDDFARSSSMHRVRLYAMPANNHVAVWVKQEGRQKI
jgi:cyclopropane fatty-acyl-phospholipid synthase-like methyltransferase